MKVVFLKPRSSIRENLSSDSLWGLICWGIRTVYSEKKLVDFIKHYEGSGDVLKLSSAFFVIFGEKNKRQLLFPKPVMPQFELKKYLADKPAKDKLLAMTRLKNIKKQKFVTLDILNKFITGEFDELDYFSYFDKQGSTVPVVKLKRTEMTHNTINRLTNTTAENSLYTKDEIFLPENTGLFFLLDGPAEMQDMVFAALRYFEHAGFMGDAGIGKGSFKIEIDDFDFPEVENPDSFLSLSLYHPAKDEVTFYSSVPQRCSYNLVSRKGKISSAHLGQSDFWKRSILLFAEGSVFPLMNKKNYGYNPIVKKASGPVDFNVHHFGTAFNISMRIKKT